jgi:polyhydroxyalkanoate synthesis repressor PhaR
MHKIKKYANRKLYDGTAKHYISMDQLSALLRAGKDVEIMDNETGEDITASVVSQLIARDAADEGKTLSPGILIQLFRKGGSALNDYAKKYLSLWQGAFTMAEDEIDTLVRALVKNREITRSEAGRLKQEITGFTASLRTWISDAVDARLGEVLGAMNLVRKDEITGIMTRIRNLEERLDAVEKSGGPGRTGTAAGRTGGRGGAGRKNP